MGDEGPEGFYHSPRKSNMIYDAKSKTFLHMMYGSSDSMFENFTHKHCDGECISGGLRGMYQGSERD